MALVPYQAERGQGPKKGHYGIITPQPKPRRQNQELEMTRKLRTIDERMETPNADKDPIRYQWYTRPQSRQPLKDKHVDKRLGVKEKSRKQETMRVDTMDIFDAVRNQIRSPPEMEIRNRLHDIPDQQSEVNNILAQYLAGCTSHIDPILSYKYLQRQEAGCACCAQINSMNKWHRQSHLKASVPLLSQSNYFYDTSPDEIHSIESILTKRRGILTEAHNNYGMREGIEENSYQKNMRKLKSTIDVLGEPIDPLELPQLPYKCQVANELEPETDYFQPGVVPTKYMAFAPRNPLRHRPPHLGDDDYKSFKHRGRMKYVSFSPRRPDIKVYTPEDGYTMSVAPHKLVPRTPILKESYSPRE